MTMPLLVQVRDQMADSTGHASLQARIAAALMTSAVGILMANPSDVVKVRMQVGVLQLVLHSQTFWVHMHHSLHLMVRVSLCLPLLS